MKKTLLFWLVVSLAFPSSVLASTTWGSMGDDHYLFSLLFWTQI